MYHWCHQVPLGQYPKDHFSEKIPCKLIEDFQGELQESSAAIKARNENLEIPYTYLDPKELENSVAIWISEGVTSTVRSCPVSVCLDLLVGRLLHLRVFSCLSPVCSYISHLVCMLLRCISDIMFLFCPF